MVLAVDGPAGPVFSAKKGCVELASAASVPIVPVAYRCSRAHEFAWRWDRTLMPLPFGRIEIVYGAPMRPDNVGEVEAALNALV